MIGFTNEFQISEASSIVIEFTAILKILIFNIVFLHKENI